MNYLLTFKMVKNEGVSSVECVEEFSFLIILTDVAFRCGGGQQASAKVAPNAWNSLLVYIEETDFVTGR